MRDAPLEQDVLAATVTEDDYALWELVGMARARSADASEPELNAHAREALESLLRDGLVRVYRREGEDEFPVTGLALSHALADDRSWEVAAFDEGLVVASTPEGERVYKELQATLPEG